jgi:hypothetical protein
MKALVVYESMFGNTREIAEAVVAGLSDQVDVTLHDVGSGPPGDLSGWDLVVLGAPTHAFSLSRPSTRADAIAQGGTEGSASSGLREWMESLTAPAPGQAFACFDTRASAVRHLPGSAAHKVSRLARSLGFSVIGRESFWVSGTPGPLVEGDLERARLWGTALARELSASAKS